MPTFSTMGSLYPAFTSLLVFAICICHAVGCPRVIPRSEWGAESPTSTTSLSSNLPYAVIHHTVTEPCITEDSCKLQLRGIQDDHMGTRRFDDIGYNFLIGGDGNVYEGRGWGYRGAHAKGKNSQSLGIAMMGSFTLSAPGQNVLDVLDEFLDCAVNRGALQSSYILIGHRQVKSYSTVCPGNALYNKLKQHAHYSSV